MELIIMLFVLGVLFAFCCMVWLLIVVVWAFVQKLINKSRSANNHYKS